jgi:hypothetical protein
MATVIDSPALRLGERLIASARAVLAAYAGAALLAPPAIRTSHLAHFGADAVAVGAAALVRYRVTRPLDRQRIARRAQRTAPSNTNVMDALA